MNEKDYYRITPLSNNFRIWKDKIYMCASNYNGLFQADIADGMLDFVDKFVEQDFWGANLFTIEVVENILIFMPVFANEIALYDLEAGELYEIYLDNIYIRDITNTSSLAVYGDRIWLFPAKSKYIVELDYKKKQVGMVIDIYSIYHNFFNIGYGILGVNGSYVYGEKVLLACWEKPYIIEFYAKNKTFEFVKVEGCNLGFGALGGEGSNLYVLNDDGYLYVWDIENKSVIKKICIDEGEKRLNNKFYRKMHVYKEKVYIFPYNKILYMKEIDVRLEKTCTGIPKWMQNQYEGLIFGYADKNKMYFYTDQNYIICIDLEKRHIEWDVNIKYDAAKLRKRIAVDKDGKQNLLIMENKAFLVQDFLQLITASTENCLDNVFNN